jgi:hypothetical protein
MLLSLDVDTHDCAWPKPHRSESLRRKVPTSSDFHRKCDSKAHSLLYVFSTMPYGKMALLHRINRHGAYMAPVKFCCSFAVHRVAGAGATSLKAHGHWALYSTACTASLMTAMIGSAKTERCQGIHPPCMSLTVRRRLRDYAEQLGPIVDCDMPTLDATCVFTVPTTVYPLQGQTTCCAGQ